MQVEIEPNSAPLTKNPSKKEMLSVSEENGVTRVKINSSSLSIIQECGRKAWYVLERELRSNLEGPATLFGTGIHAALEVYYSGEFKERIIPPRFRSDAEMMPYSSLNNEDDFLMFRAIRAFVEKNRPLESLPDDDKRSIATGVWLLCNYFETWIDDPYVVARDEDGPLVERTFTTRLLDDSNLIIDLFGTIDVVLAHKNTGQVLICDHKTSSVVGKDFYNRLKPNHQYTGYILGAQRELGIDTDKFMVNCLQVKQRPKTARGTPPQFPRQVTTRSDEDLEEFCDAVEDAVRNFLHWREDGRWPMGHVNACCVYGGCQFIDVCSSPKSVRENIINANYEGK